MNYHRDLAEGPGATPPKEGALMNAPGDLNGLAKERRDILWGLYQENIAHARHHETIRATASNIILLISVTLIGFIAHGGLSINDWPLTGAMIPIGIYGAMFTSTYFESICRYQRRAKKYFLALASLVRPAEAPQTLEYGLDGDDCSHDEMLPKFRDLSWLSLLRTLWPLTISLIGIAATAYLFYAWPMPECVAGAAR